MSDRRFAVARDSTNDYRYDWDVLTHEADRVLREQPRSTVVFLCAYTGMAIGGFVPADPDGSKLEITPQPRAFLTKPWIRRLA